MSVKNKSTNLVSLNLMVVCVVGMNFLTDMFFVGNSEGNDGIEG